ncbi:ydeG-like MFS-type transporter [Actinoplanes sp. SE50]|uniref:MFS transporter n=1 Tax=unclassified Actinoplanes TaxID=2626549 RepID=UPI00023ED0E3|nr:MULTISPECIES: MFS transporter [unclassified Actinoplanes]AEV86105.1 ydeG-like uncharacterized MFS-type transporter [Actinoplanes sp. SE50/110]ATO84503.1 ydeG-like MFS-type transporter [Actinoplanes sp. SE50]SLM01913.1 ydeG-like MFS-type transporter [Actinoplanes sp. SE50/110]
MAKSLFVAAAAMNTAMATASPVATLVVADRLGPAWGGVPSTAAITGTGVGALILARSVSRRGWRHGLLVAFCCAVAGGLLAAAARGPVPLSVALVLLGYGNAGALLARYAVAETHPARHRGTAMGLLVWAGAIGAVGGPLLLGVLHPATVVFLVAALAAAAAAAGAATLPRTVAAEPPTGRMDLSGIRTPLLVMGTAQVVMVAVMTAAPVEMHVHHHGLATIGVVLSAHTLGMFALSPVTGRLADRLGARPVMAAGLVTVAAGPVLAAVGAPRVLAFLLLGYGWNLCLIGGSAVLATRVPEPLRARAEGTVDGMVWVAAAAGGLASTGLLTIGGYGLLAALAVAAIGPAGLSVVRLQNHHPVRRDGQ